MKKLFPREFRNPITHAILTIAVQRPVRDHGVECRVAGGRQEHSGHRHRREKISFSIPKGERKDILGGAVSQETMTYLSYEAGSSIEFGA